MDEAGPKAKKYDFTGWLQWSKADSIAMSSNEDIEYKKRAFYRLGMIMQGEGDLANAVSHLRKVKVADPKFLR